MNNQQFLCGWPSLTAKAKLTTIQIQEMLKTHRDVQSNIGDALAHCIDECYSCAATCTICADACLAEKTVEQLKQCIRLNLDCADVCIGTGKLASRRTGSDGRSLKQVLQVRGEACRICGEECRRHAKAHEHCRICAEACQQCEDACRGAVQDVG